MTLPFPLFLMLVLFPPSWCYYISPKYSLSSTQTKEVKSRCELHATPKRLEENIGGVLYVNERCINCAACSNFAPTVFDRNDGIYKHVVFNQPNIDNRDEINQAKAALMACPVAAIQIEKNMHDEDELKQALSIQNGKSFPQQLYPMTSESGEAVDVGVYYLGHHNEASFGAIPYLVLGKSTEGKDIAVMVDVPRFSQSAVNAVKSIVPSGPDYMFLTHVDDTAGHNKWRREFPALKRIFHSGDLGRHNWVGDLTLEDVEILLQEVGSDDDGDLKVWDIKGNQQPFSKLKQMEHGELMLIHTPGHSPGSISLLFSPKHHSREERLLSVYGNEIKYPRGILFTGDTYAWTTRDGGHMSGFPLYGNDLSTQAKTLKKLGSLRQYWDVIAPGHGHPRFYLNDHDKRDNIKIEDINAAVKELCSFERR